MGYRKEGKIARDGRGKSIGFQVFPFPIACRVLASYIQRSNVHTLNSTSKDKHRQTKSTIGDPKR